MKLPLKVFQAVLIMFAFFVLTRVVNVPVFAAGTDAYDVWARVFIDRNNNNVFDTGIDYPLSGETVTISDTKNKKTTVNPATDAFGWIYLPPEAGAIGTFDISNNDIYRWTHNPPLNASAQKIYTYGIRPAEGGDFTINNGTSVTIKGKDQIIQAFFMPFVPPPGAFKMNPATTDCLAINQPYIDISWQASSGVVYASTDGYDIYRNGVIIGAVPPGVTNFRDPTGGNFGNPAPINNGVYSYYIIAKNLGGSTQSNTNVNNFQAKNCAPAATPTPTPTPTSTPTPTPTPIPAAPSIVKLQVQPGDPTVVGALNGISGNQKAQSGGNWYNPMDITLITTGSPTEQYVVFYDKSSLGSAYTNPGLLNNVQNFLAGDFKRGFLLGYGTGTPANCAGAGGVTLPCAGTPRHYVWRPNDKQWIELDVLPDKRVFICSNIASCSSTNHFFLIRRGNPANWIVTFDTSSITKSMYSGAYVNSPSGGETSSDINPTN